jgi:hypothetical protein
MYAACLFCHSHLGRNHRLARFPVGRRLAYDRAKGRLWVVCRSCGRWNLTPLEERWEAMEECERLFRGTRIRVSTEHIGLAELRDGVSLIRIGKPLWPEFVAWRYGRRFFRRRVKAGMALGAIVSGALGATFGAVAAGFVGTAYLASYATALWIADEGPKRRPVTSVRLGGRLLHLRQDDAEATRLFAEGGRDEYGLALHHTGGVELLRGPDVRRVLGKVVPALSPFGGSAHQVSGAIDLIDGAGNAETWITGTMERATRLCTGWLTDLPVEMRLALEMSLQEDGERRAFDGELAALEAAWREAEQIAAIADTLLLPADLLDRIAGLRQGIVRRPAFLMS